MNQERDDEERQRAILWFLRVARAAGFTEDEAKLARQLRDTVRSRGDSEPSALREPEIHVLLAAARRYLHVERRASVPTKTIGNADDRTTGQHGSDVTPIERYAGRRKLRAR